MMRLAAAALGALALAAPAHAQPAARASAEGAVRIVEPVSIIANQDLILGSILLRAADAVAPLPPVASAGRAAGDSDIASFEVVGEVGQSVSIAVPPTVALTGPGDPLPLRVGATTTAEHSGAGPPRSLVLVRVARPRGRQVHTGKYRGVIVATAQYD